MKSYVKNLFLSFACFLMCTGLFGVDFPSITPLFDVSLYNKVLTGEELIQLGLEFSECSLNSEKGKRAFEIYKKLESKCDEASLENLGIEEKGEKILEILYREVLVQYEEGQSRLDVTLERGVYNCVTASVLYMALSKYVGLMNIQAQKTPTHAFLTLSYKNNSTVKKIDIETTNPYGFNPGTKKIMEESSEYTKYYFVPKQNYSNRQFISENGLVGLIASNLCSYYVKINDYNKALPVAVSAYLLLKDDQSAKTEARRNMDVVACNYLARQNITIKLVDYVPFLAAYVDKFGMSSYVQDNFDSLLYNVIVLYTNNKDAESAGSFFNTYERYLSQKQKSQLDYIIFETQILDYYNNSNDSEDFIKYCVKFKTENPKLEKNKLNLINTLHENSWIMVLNQFIESDDYIQGYKLSGNAIFQLPQSSVLKKMNQNFGSNGAIVIHNEFVTLVNKKLYEESKRKLEEGLEIFPASSLLKDDMKKLRQLTDN